MKENIHKSLVTIQAMRNYLLSQLDSLTTEELNFIPKYFNNNIIWNLAHMNTVLILLFYKNTNTKPFLDEEIINEFLPGSKPLCFYNEQKIDLIKNIFISTVTKLEEDYNNSYFSDYQIPLKIKEKFNLEITSLEDAILYILHHEGIHYSEIMKLIRINLNKNARKSEN
jgi:hypothetical protein